MPKKLLTSIAFVALLLSGLGVSILMIFPYLMSLFIGGFLALLAYPLFQKLRKRRLGPRLAGAIITFGIVALVMIPLSLFIVLAVQQGIAIIDALDKGDGDSLLTLFNRVNGLPIVHHVFGVESGLENQIRAWIQEFGKTAGALILATVAAIPTILLQLAIVTVSCFFFLADGSRFVAWMIHKIPLDTDVRTKLSQSLRNSTRSVFWSTVAAAAVQSAIMSLAFVVLSVPAAVFAAGATFILAWIPIVGSTPVWLGGAAYLYFFDGSILKAILMLVFGIVCGLSDNFVRPAILKGRENMHPLVSLIAIFGGITLFGIMGVFIGPILAAVVISLLEIWPSVAHRFGLMQER
jgi:predicted PurR-regulated permease PerM